MIHSVQQNASDQKNLPILLLEYLLLRLVGALIRLLPFSVGMAAARWVGRLLYVLLARYRTIALENLRAAFGDEKTASEVKKIAVQSFKHLAVFGLEFIWIPKMTKHLDRYLLVEGADRLWNALNAKNGVVLIVSHFGNWEWMAVGTGAEGFPMHAVARPLRNPFVYDYVKKLRGITGLKSVDKKGAVRQAVKLIKKNQVLCVLIDQHERQGSVRVPFFGREALTPTLPAILALRRSAVVMPLFFYREKHPPSRMIFYDPFPVIETGDYKRDVFENTKQYVQFIEGEIRKRPGDWLWMHRRWR
ncbi:MAG: hypothetical protein A3G87_09460 [Omnitrophica bacterium RIFCSPLOWO2_12_FULL_50_11]|nr:MAG: hypothetical protein A3G87_09460 [Omnitrophica bacterium RIFCSPLOWO2_12_FULL_50_11]